MYDLGKRFQEIDENGEEIYVEIAKFGLTKEVEFAMMQEKALQEKEQDATTDKEVSDSSRNSDDSERFSDSDDDMTTNWSYRKNVEILSDILRTIIIPF